MVPARSRMLARLSLMMLLEFAVFGSWFATLGLVLAVHGMASLIGSAYLLSAVAAILSPLCFGALGDRLFATQKVLAGAQLAGACIAVALPSAIAAGRGGLTLVLILAYMLTFVPTLGLVNVIGLHHLPDQGRHFPYVRVFGTGGWILAGLGVGAVGLSGSANIFYVTAGVAALFGVFALTLPDTPPQSQGSSFSLGDLIGAKALPLFQDRSFTVLMGCALLTSISLGVYNSFASPYLATLGLHNVAGVLAIGQISEVVFLVTIPWALAHVGMKWSLLAGMALWGMRFALFLLASRTEIWPAVLAVALHGICNDFFLVISAMYVDRIAPRQMAAQAQGWLILVISGFGNAIGASVSGYLYGTYVVPRLPLGSVAWSTLWYVPIGTALVTALLWIRLFRPHDRPVVGVAAAG